MFQLALTHQTYDSKRMADEKLIISTAGSKEEAARIAHALVSERLAACVNIVGPIESIYRWQGNIESAAEFLILVKTVSAKSAMVMSRIHDLHSYELPEALEVAIDGGSPKYLKWIAESCGSSARG
jgi:periplasmic divalent cation tolerance protein